MHQQLICWYSVLYLVFLFRGLFYFAFDDHKQKKTSTQVAQTQADKKDDDLKLEFEFHSILPELDVVIPEQLTETLRDVLPKKKPEEKKNVDTVSVEEKPAQGDTYFIQAGSFKKNEDAERMKIKLLLLGLDVHVQSVNVEGAKYHRVRIGPLTDFDSFDRARARLKENGVQYLVLKTRG